MKTKICARCKKRRLAKSFRTRIRKLKDGLTKEYLYSYCRQCEKKEDRAKVTPYNRRIRLYRTRYGITIEDYDRMFKEQNGRCAICKTDKPIREHFHIDHCHETKKVRGLLCIRCNSGLGSFKDSKKLLWIAMNYLNGDKKN
jgi:hypothetical protein